MRFRCKSNPSIHTPDSNLAEKRKSGFQNFANLRPWILNLRMRSESQCNMCACPSAQAGTHTPQQGDVAGPAITETSVVMGPRLRGDDSGLVWSRDITEPYWVVAW